ncbi:MAG: LacI family DNA-binding transcriptional regulator [Actinobacteria bacterium]|nr:LacI family DNA-binding transcriptional regulator [Actinomycetota bacterium]
MPLLWGRSCRHLLALRDVPREAGVSVATVSRPTTMMSLGALQNLCGGVGGTS